MKIQPLLLQMIGFTLVATSCSPSRPAQESLSAGQQQQVATPRQQIPLADTTIADSTGTREITPDYCPPCGRG